jgi:hypothetical protein
MSIRPVPEFLLAPWKGFFEELDSLLYEDVLVASLLAWNAVVTHMPLGMTARTRRQPCDDSFSGSYLCIFHHFPFENTLTAIKCRQFSVLGLSRGSLGSS